MNGIFNDTDQYQTGVANADADQLKQAQVAQAQVEAAAAQRKSQADIDLDQATRGGLRAAGYGAPAPAPAPAPAAPAAPAPVAQGAAPGVPAPSGPMPGPSGAAAPAPTPAGAAAMQTVTGGAPAGFSPIARASALRQSLTGAYANTPGGGAQGSAMAFQDVAAQTDVMHKVFEMAATDPQMAEQYAAQAGMPLPQGMRSVLENRALNSQVLKTFEDSKNLYPNERDALQRWQYVRGRLTAMQATQQQPGQTPADTGMAPIDNTAANPPEPRAPKPDFAMQPITSLKTDDKGHMQPFVASFDPNSGAVTQSDTAGFGRGAGTAGYWRNEFGAQGNSVWAQKQQAWLATHPGDQQGALQYAAGHKQIGQAEWMHTAHTMALQEVMNNPAIKGKDKDAELQKRTQAYMQRLIQLDQTPAAPDQPAPAAAPAAPAAAPAAAPTTGVPGPGAGPQAVAPAGKSPYPQFPDARQAPDGKWYVQRQGQSGAMQTFEVQQ